MYLIKPGIVYLRADGYDSGHFIRSNRCNIYVSIAFPPMLSDSRFTLVEGSLQLCTDSAYSFFNAQIFSVRSLWTASDLTFNRQPVIGNLLDARSIGGAASPQYWTILGTEGLLQLLTDLRTNGVLYGIVVQVGVITQTGFYSNRASLNQPKTVFRVRY